MQITIVLSNTHSFIVNGSDDLDEKAKVPVVQQRGRFKVTSENVDFEKVRFHCIISTASGNV